MRNQSRHGCRRYGQQATGRGLFADSWEFALRRPFCATSTGDARYNDRLPRETLVDHARRLEAERDFLARLQKISRDLLAAASK